MTSLVAMASTLVAVASTLVILVAVASTLEWMKPHRIDSVRQVKFKANKWVQQAQPGAAFSSCVESEEI